MAEEAVTKPTAGPDQVKLALERTFLAHERTLMAWVRTATSLITYGFALYKFFYYTHQDRLPTHGCFHPAAQGGCGHIHAGEWETDAVRIRSAATAI